MDLFARIGGIEYEKIEEGYAAYYEASSIVIRFRHVRVDLVGANVGLWQFCTPTHAHPDASGDWRPQHGRARGDAHHRRGRNAAATRPHRNRGTDTHPYLHGNASARHGSGGGAARTRHRAQWAEYA